MNTDLRTQLTNMSINQTNLLDISTIILSALMLTFGINSTSIWSQLSYTFFATSFITCLASFRFGIHWVRTRIAMMDKNEDGEQSKKLAFLTKCMNVTNVIHPILLVAGITLGLIGVWTNNKAENVIVNKN